MDLFYEYLNQKEEIEQEIGEKLEWMELPGKKASRIKISLNADFADKLDWKNQFEWLKRYSEIFATTFKMYSGR